MSCQLSRPLFGNTSLNARAASADLSRKRAYAVSSFRDTFPEYKFREAEERYTPKLRETTERRTSSTAKFHDTCEHRALCSNGSNGALRAGCIGREPRGRFRLVRDISAAYSPTFKEVLVDGVVQHTQVVQTGHRPLGSRPGPA